MRDFEVRFKPSARKELAALPAYLSGLILPRIEMLALDPRPRGTKKLQGTENTWRIRVGDFRIVYNISSGERIVRILAVTDRKNAYR